MIQSVMLCGIGLLAGCLLMLMFLPLVHERAVRLTKRQLVDATPMIANEIQADKDHLRAEFAMSVRRLEIGMEAMRSKAKSRAADTQHAEISRLQVELDKKTAMIFALRAREEVRKSAVRRVVKILLYIFVRSNRRARYARVEPVWYEPERQLTWGFDREAEDNERAVSAAAIAALNVKRRQAVSNKY
jgi:hypothetical protein